MLKSEMFHEAVLQNQNTVLTIEEEFILKYLRYLKKYSTVLSRFKRLCRTLPREDRIILKAELISTLSSQDQMYYFKLLEENQMRLKDEALDCVSEIATAKDPVWEAKKWSKLPWLSIDIQNDNYYTVTFQNEHYSFRPIRSVFPNEIRKIEQYHFNENVGIYEEQEWLNPALAPGVLDYACHFSTDYFSNFFPNVFAVTSLCPHIVQNGFWYHSFNLSKDESTVYDVANGFIMDYETFQKLLEPILLDQTLGQDISSKQKLLINSENDFYAIYGEVCPLKGFAFQNFDSFSSKKQKELHDCVRKLRIRNELD